MKPFYCWKMENGSWEEKKNETNKFNNDIGTQTFFDVEMNEIKNHRMEHFKQHLMSTD